MEDSFKRVLKSVKKYNEKKKENDYYTWKKQNKYEINMLYEIIVRFRYESNLEILNLMKYEDWCFFLYNNYEKL